MSCPGWIERAGSRQWDDPLSGRFRHRPGQPGSGPAAPPARTFLIGDEPDVPHRIPLETEPQKVWTAQVGFRCTTASLLFNPVALAVGEEVRDGAADGNDRLDANTSEHCLTERAALSQRPVAG